MTPETLQDALLALVSLGLVSVAGAFFARAWAHQRVARARASRRASPRDPLAPGPAIVFGAVSTTDRQPPIRIRVLEQGRDCTRPGHPGDHGDPGESGHEWVEIARRTIAVPFELVLPDGRAIPVEPGGRVILTEPLGTVARRPNDQRVREAALEHGADAYVDGVIEARLTGGRKSLVLAPRDDEALLVSREPLDARPRTWSSFHLGAAGATLLTLSLLHALDAIAPSSPGVLLFSAFVLVLSLGAGIAHGWSWRREWYEREHLVTRGPGSLD